MQGYNEFAKHIEEIKILGEVKHFSKNYEIKLFKEPCGF